MTTCPYCGCQIHSPFPWERRLVIHDIDLCMSRMNSLSRAGEMVPSLACSEEAGPAILGNCGVGEISEEQRADERIDQKIQDKIDMKHFKNNPLTA